MNRVGKLPGNGRFILLISQEEYLQLKAHGFSIKDSMPIQNQIFGFNKHTVDDNKEQIKQPYHDSILWKVCEKFFDLQISRNPSTLRFQKLVKLEKLIRQGKGLNPTQRSSQKQELTRRNIVLEKWYGVLLQIEVLGYSHDYIFKVIQFAENDIPTREELQKNPNWHGWAKNLLSLNTLLIKSRNGIVKWENIIRSYEDKLQKEKWFFGDLNEIDGELEI